MLAGFNPKNKCIKKLLQQNIIKEKQKVTKVSSTINPINSSYESTAIDN